MNSVPDKTCQPVFDLRLLKVIEDLGRNINAGYLDSGIKHAKQRVFQGLKIVQPRRYSAVAVDLKVLNLVSRDSIIFRRRILRHCYSP